MDKKADRATEQLLRKVDKMEAELRALRPKLNKAITEYGLRRGYRGYRDFHLRCALAAQGRNMLEKSNG